MKKSSLFLVTTFLLLLSSCQVVGDIFKAGVWVGILIVVVIVGIIIWLIAKVSGGGKS